VTHDVVASDLKSSIIIVNLQSKNAMFN